MKRELKIGDSQRIVIKNEIVHLPQSDAIWMSGHEIAHLFECFTSKVNSNIRSILKSGVFHENEVCKTISTSDGGSVELYNLEMIIALSFRIKSKNAEIFRQWTVKKMMSQDIRSMLVLPLQNAMLN